MPNEFTAIAFDYGTKRIGIAIGQSVTRSATPLAAINAQNGIPDWQEIEKLINEWGATHAIVGLPLNMDGTQSELCLRAKKFANRLHGRFGVKITMQDERLTTKEAKLIAQELGHKGQSYADDPVDAIAAQLILEGFWQSQAGLN